ncbi:MAG: PilZ domain-containing protein [Candidatus Omnitrophica bacterium]|nr:PilZ domain-containing protein [Candidatus Omnitrophota bacterium]
MIWGGAEKRRFVRANFPCKIAIHIPSRHTLSTHTENIGVGGIRVIIGEKSEIFSTVGLEIFLGEEPIICNGRVVWVVENKSNYQEDFFSYDTGMEFVDIKEEDRAAIKNFVEAIVLSK